MPERERKLKFYHPSKRKELLTVFEVGKTPK